MSTADGKSHQGDAAVIASLVGGATWREAAAETGVSEATITRRMRDEGFRATLAEAQREVVKSAVRRLAQTAVRAAAKLEELLDAESESVQLGAARAAIQLLPDVSGLIDVEDRLVRLEALFSKGNGGRL
jgi:DNA-binding MurR/RpiR family transcriptional regulator